MIRTINFLCLSRCQFHGTVFLSKHSLHTSSNSNNENEKKKLNPKHFFLLICPLTAFCLGYWQIQRRKWKLGIIKKIEEILPSPTIDLPMDIKASTDLVEFQPVFVEGYFKHNQELLIGPRSIITDEIEHNGYGSAWGSKPSSANKSVSNLSNFGAPSSTGYCVVTPLELRNRPGTHILVNRGWIPTYSRDPITRPNGQIKGLVNIKGYIRYNESPPPFTPDPKAMHCTEPNQSPHYQYFCREVLRMSARKNTLPVFIDANYDSSIEGGPIGGQTKINIRNQHAEYIFTWFTLGTVTLGMWVYWLFF